LRFDTPVPAGGYAWWYVDAVSDDGAFGISIIAFIGSVFSPYYAWARRRGVSDPLDHCSINVSLYGKGVRRWAMTERSARQVHVAADRFAVGPSNVRWDGRTLDIAFDEIAVPIPRRLQGRIRITPEAVTETAFVLNPQGRHLWWPIAPQGRAEVVIDQPGLAFQGHAYLDHNRGDTPITEGFRHWTWSRATNDGIATILYDGIRKAGDSFLLGLEIDGAGRIVPFSPPPRVKLPTAPIWRIPRETRSEPGAPTSVMATLEDTPFYARSLVRSRMAGRELVSVHESLSVDRFSSPVVQMMLPFRMPRRR
jgi:carotenoid 1,2-hydratase